MKDPLKNCSRQLAVRIAIDDGKNLIGSGIVLPCEQDNCALLFTAAHVLERVNKNEALCVHLCFGNERSKPQIKTLTLTKAGEDSASIEEANGIVFFHPQYVYHTILDKIPQYDGAIVKFEYSDWMSQLPRFEISDIDNDVAMLVGFPKYLEAENLDDPKYEKHITYRVGLFSDKVDVNDDGATYNLVITHNFPRKPLGISDNHLQGLSGGGLISKNDYSLSFNGVFVSTKDEGYDTYYATSSRVFRQILDYYNIKITEPNDLHTIFKSGIDYRFGGLLCAGIKKRLEENEGYLDKLYYKKLFDEEKTKGPFLTCNSYRPLCLPFHFNKLIGTMLVNSEYKLTIDDDGKQFIKLDDESEVCINHICSEADFKDIVTETLKSVIDTQDLHGDGAIFIVSNKKKDQLSNYFEVKGCRNIVPNLFAYMHNDNQNGLSIVSGYNRPPTIGFACLGALENVWLHNKKDGVKKLFNEIWGV